MQEIKFYYGKQQQQKIGLFFLGLAILGAAFSVYLFLFDDVIRIRGRVTSIFITILGYAVFIKLQLAPKKNNEVAVAINQQGIEAKTTPVAKSAGLIIWSDIDEITVHKNQIIIIPKDKQKYQQRMKGIMAKDGFKLAQGTIRISTIEVNATSQEIENAIHSFM